MSVTGCYQKLAPWLCTPVDRQSRLYLETHLELLAEEFEQFLDLFIGQHADNPPEQQRLRSLRQLLHDARVRGGTGQAVREAYVNLFGGLMLDTPVWLTAMARQFATISSTDWNDRLIAMYKVQLKDALERAREENEVAPEVVAELQYQLGNLFANDASHYSLAVLEKAVGYYEAALDAYTVACYPLQHVKTLIALGNVYGRFSVPVPQRSDALEKALHCYKRALRTCSASPAVAQILPT